MVSGQSVVCVMLQPPSTPAELDAVHGGGVPLLGGPAELVCETQVDSPITSWDFSRNSSKGVVHSVDGLTHFVDYTTGETFEISG